MNRHQLNILAYSLTQKPLPGVKRKIPNTTHAMLPTVHKCFATRADAEACFPAQGSRVIVGIDPGVKRTATAFILDSVEPGRPLNLTISQGSHSYTTRAYSKSLELAKTKKNIHVVECSIQPVDCPVAPVDQQLDCWIALQRSIEDHVKFRRASP
ncbi:hypothetical protein BGZ67_010106, partial [Mortierella alpina]